MRRVVLFTNTYAPLVGGLERSVANVHEDLTRLGHFSRVITPVFRGADVSVGGILRLPAITGVGEKEFSIALPSLKRLDDWMEAIEPELLHTHQPFLLGETAWRIAKRRQVPLVFTHHTLYERYAHYLLVDNERARRVVIALTTHYANRCQLVIAPTRSVQTILEQRGVTVPIAVAPTGIDLILYRSGSRERARAALGLAIDVPVIGHLGRLSQEKNLEVLIEAVIVALKKLPAAKFLLVGDGDRLEWSKRRFAEENLAERVFTPGMLSSRESADAYAAMDVFVFASLTDTQGLVLAEAMAAGVPVIALDAPGARDCIKPDVTGFLLPAGAEAAALATQIISYLDDKGRHASFQENCRRAATDFGREACIERLLGIYELAIAEFRPEVQPHIDLWDQLTDTVDVTLAPFWDRFRTVIRSLASRAPEDSRP